jgi:copper oxidase (laccase) domain-containing protein
LLISGALKIYATYIFAYTFRAGDFNELSSQQADIIQSLTPVLKQHRLEITARFYQRLFEAHTELLNIFNHTNQRKGKQDGDWQGFRCFKVTRKPTEAPLSTAP